MYDIPLRFASLVGAAEGLTVPITLIIVAILLAIFVGVIVWKFQKKLSKQTQQFDETDELVDVKYYSDPNIQDSWWSDQKQYLASAFRSDINPKTWLSKFSQVSMKHLLMMTLFYHAVGIGLAAVGTSAIVYFYPTYEDPEIAFAMFDALAAGPIEETLAFGIPLYASGNQFVVLITGSLWALAHVLNTDDFAVDSLAYGNLLFVIPSMFLSLRTWASGKGWFSIIIHSGWNMLAFNIACGVGEIPCNVFQGENELSLSAILSSPLAAIITAEVLLLITYLLYYRKTRKEINRQWAGQPTASSLSGYNTSSYGGALSSILIAPKRSSRYWYLLPVGLAFFGGFLGIIAGLVLYFKFRARDSRMARNALLLGILAFAVWLGISIALPT